MLQQRLKGLKFPTVTAAKACRPDMVCERYRVAIARSTCVARQQPSKRGERVEDPFCRSGRCSQGAAVLADAGAVTDAGRWCWVTCVHCGGKGRHPMPVPVDVPSTKGRRSKP